MRIPERGAVGVGWVGTRWQTSRVRSRSFSRALTACSCLAGGLVLAGCGGGSGPGGGTNSNAYKLASLDQGSYASSTEVARYQAELDRLDAYCRENQDQLSRMVYAAATKLTAEGAPTSSLGFMRAVLTPLLGAGVAPRGKENCVVGFALTMTAVRADGGAG